LVFSTSTSPPDIYALDLGSLAITRWTFSEIGGLQEAQLVEAELIHYPTFDSIDGKPRMISALVHLPKGAGPFPVLLSLHGGPASQSRPVFSMDARIIQYLVNELGIAVIQPNVRGSSGYGFDFRNLDNGMLRENAVKDVGALLQWVGKNEKLDPSKVAVEGGSYGGYLALASLIHYSDQLKAGIDMWGISNFISFADYIAKNRDAGNLSYQRREYGDERDPEVKSFLEAISPVNHLGKIKIPVLVIHGANDFRVPLSQSEEVVEAFRNNGQIFWYLVAKDDGHGFQNKSNAEYAVQIMALFLKTYLLE
jgi:dipeptidyl aminopeptidase/acylaminoacyl peptidase